MNHDINVTNVHHPPFTAAYGIWVQTSYIQICKSPQMSFIGVLFSFGEEIQTANFNIYILLGKNTNSLLENKAALRWK